MCKCCGCDGRRECCSPIIPPTEKAKNYRVALVVVTVLHFLVFFVKAHYMGFFSGLTDLAACIILIVATVRFDYCLIMVYIVINLFETFALIVVLGYYLQTDMGKNAPGNKAKDGEENHSGINSGHKSHKGKSSVVVIFRGLFDELLKAKYSFYQSQTYAQDFGAKVAGAASPAPEDHVTLQAQGDEDKTEKLSKKYGPTFIITFCSALIVFYLVTALVVHYAYREYKGIAEDIAGGSIDFTDGNVLHYAVISKREDDAIEEREELQKRARER